MKTFKDSAGREWSLRITFATIRDVRDQFNLDLGREADVKRAFDDWETFLKIVNLLLAQQIDAAKLTARDLEDALDAEAWERAANALADEIVFFSPSRAASAQVMEAVRERRAAVETINAADLAEKIRTGQMDAIFKLSPTVGASPESSGSAPTPTPSAN